MQLLGVRPVSPTPTETAALNVRQDKDFDDKLKCALQRHKDESDRVVKKSFDQVQRSVDVTVAIKSIVAKIDHQMSLETAEGAYDLLRGQPRDDGSS
jgi:hypothetical protein